jgi:enediyne biosynthesis protein E8
VTVRPTRRQLLQGMLAALALLEVGEAPASGAATMTDLPSVPMVQATLEAFADTLVPGEKRFPGDRVVAGAAKGAGAVQAGVGLLLHMPEAGMEALLPELATLLNAEATAYAARHVLVLDPTVPPLVALPFDARTALACELLDPSHADQQVWILLAFMVFLAFHTAGFEHTADAVRGGHPGLARLRFPAPGPDGLYRYTDFSYRRPLAGSHPQTTKGGSPA